jgi:hypothetical protein
LNRIAEHGESGARLGRTLLFGGLAFVVAAALAALFWRPLASGGGFIGGDTYNYFFPLKDFYAEGLRNYTVYLWHPRIGNGAPVLGESQTGALYPFNLLAYSLLDLNAAYNAVFLTHYVLAFLFTFLLGRSLRLSFAASVLVAVVYVYGWFPPRACLEWAVVTGAWTPAVLGAGLQFLESGRWRWGAAASAALAVQLLAGHFNLAWVTLVALALLVLVRPTAGVPPAAAWRRKAALVPFLLLAFGLAGVQVLPAWELKSRSQREDQAFRAQIEEGLVPLAYLPQAAAPWRYYADPDRTLRELGAKTNKVEAHLYFGLAPLALAAAGLLSGRTLRGGWPWLLLGAAGLVLATGLVMPLLADLPGFRYFRYCGRYGLMVQLAVAVLAGMALDRFSVGPALVRFALPLVVLSATVADLYWAAQKVQYVEIVDPPILEWRGHSPVFRRLSDSDRVLAVDGNTLALSRAACVPPYLGMGPSEYYRIWDKLPDVFHGGTNYSASIAQALIETGVTHILTFDPLPPDWPATQIWRGYDPFLHRRWARDPLQPIHLYRFDPSSGRAFAIRPDGSTMPGASVNTAEIHPHKVVLQAFLPAPGRIVLTDLNFPGWTASLDGRPVAAAGGDWRRVVDVPAGEHRIVWSYRPWSVAVGAGLSALSVAVLAAFALWARRRRPG